MAKIIIQSLGSEYVLWGDEDLDAVVEVSEEDKLRFEQAFENYQAVQRELHRLFRAYWAKVRANMTPGASGSDRGSPAQTSPPSA